VVYADNQNKLLFSFCVWLSPIFYGNVIGNVYDNVGGVFG